MSGESAPKIRLVRCPKCQHLLQENPDYDVYKCGGCGTTLQAKKRRNGAVNSDSSTHTTDAAPKNASDPVSDDRQNSKREQLVIPQENGLRVKATSSSAGECSSDGNNGRGQIENGECNRQQVVLPQENGVKEKAVRSSSGECSSDGNDERVQMENGECNGEKSVLPQENDLREKETISSSGECFLDGNEGRGQIENGVHNGEQLIIPLENGVREKATRSSAGECPLDENEGRVRSENGQCNGEQAVLPQENDLTEKAKCSLDGNDGMGRSENGECNGKQLVLPQENGLREQATSSSSGESSLDGNDGRGQIEDDECEGKQLGPFNLSDEELEKEMDDYKLSDIRRHRVSNKCCSNEPDNSEIKASSELMVENSVEKANDTKLELAREELSNENMPSEGAVEELNCALDKEDVNNEKSALVGVKSEVDITESHLEGAGERNNENLLPQGAGQELISGSDVEDDNDDKSALVGANPEVDITGSNQAEAEKELNICASDGEEPKSDQSAPVVAKSEVGITGSDSTAERLSTENFVSEKGNIAHCKLEDTYDNLSSPNKQRRQAQKKVHNSFDCVRSVDIYDATEVINPSSEFSGNLRELSKSPTTRSSHHAYDGSVSSNDGVYEQFHSLDSFENTNTVANGVPEGGSRKGKGLVDSMLYGDLETQHQSYLPSAKHHALKDRRGNQNQVPETTRHGHPHWMRTKGDEFSSKMPFHRSGSQSGYESGGPSNQTHDELYCSSSFLSPDSCEEPDQEKMKLMRIVYKLQDQLDRTRYVSGETNRRPSTDVSYKGNHISTYHSHDLHERRFYHDIDYPRCDGRCTHGIHRRQRHNFSQPYLAEATSSTHLVDHPCFHCCPQEWQCSAELLPRVLYQHEELCGYHWGHSCCSSHYSLPSSPQWFVPSKLPAYGHETRSDDQRHRAPEVKNYSREKQNLNKRHYRPVAGGAPFVTCRKCFKLLQVPADFLLFKRVYHQLKCGACSEVLKFSLQNRSHIVSYAPNALGPSSSDLDDQNEMIIGNNLHSASHANYDHSSHADPVSYSDDYGHSVSKSYSSEGDPVSLTPLHPLHGNENDKPSVSHGTFEPITEENIASRGPSTSETTVGTNELALHTSNISGSEKLSSEIEARPPPKSSPLHQLMGYSSPSQVIRGVKSSVEGKETLLEGENDQSSQQN